MEKKWDTVTLSGLEKTLCKWELYVPLVTKGLRASASSPAVVTA
jgi:hypothetical protein